MYYKYYIMHTKRFIWVGETVFAIGIGVSTSTLDAVGF